MPFSPSVSPLSQRFVGACEIVLAHHTDCLLRTLDPSAQPFDPAAGERAAPPGR